MTTEIKRDLAADLAICEAATAGPWRVYGGKFGETNIYAPPYGNDHEVVSDINFGRESDAAFISEAREGWPHAIRRAIAAEAEVERLRNALEEAQYHLYRQQYMSATETVDSALEVAEDGASSR